jgi:hypothetical protein
VLLVACNTGLEAELAQRRALEQQLAEQTALLERRAALEQELRDDEAALARRGPVTLAQVEAAAGLTCTVTVARADTRALFTISGPGGKLGVHEAVTGLAALGEHVTVQRITWTPTTFTLTASAVHPDALAELRTPPSAPAPVAPATPCRGDCVDARRANTALRERLATVEASLGLLNQLPTLRRQAELVATTWRLTHHTALLDGLVMMDKSSREAGQVRFEHHIATVLAADAP